MNQDGPKKKPDSFSPGIDPAISGVHLDQFNKLLILQLKTHKQLHYNLLVNHIGR